MRPPRLTYRRLPIRILLATTLSVGFSSLWIHSIKPNEYARQVANAHQWSRAPLDRLGVAALGDIYLSDDKPLGPIVRRIISFGDRLAPNVPGSTYTQSRHSNAPVGALTFVRDFFAHLAYLLLVPLTLITILHLLITHHGNIRDSGISEVLIKMFTIAFLIPVYPWWDFVIYRGLTIPIVDFLRKGEHIDQTIRDITKSYERNSYGQQAWLAPDQYEEDPIPLKATSDEDDITARLARGAIYRSSCATELAREQPDPNAGVDCFGEHLSAEERLVNARIIVSQAAGQGDSLAMNVAAVAEQNRGGFRGIVPHLKTWGERAKEKILEFRDRIADGIDRVVDWSQENIVNPFLLIPQLFNETIVGILHFLQEAFLIAIMWAVWLGTVAARAISLTVAPIMIALSILPHFRNMMFQWFASHAKILAWPIGFSFAFLVFYLLQAGVFAAADLGYGPVGTGMRLALVILFGILTFKLPKLAGSIGTDVTRIAGDFGKFIQAKAVQGVKATAVIGTSAALGALGTVAGGVVGGAVGAAGAATSLGRAALSVGGRAALNVATRLGPTTIGGRLAGLAGKIGTRLAARGATAAATGATKTGATSVGVRGAFGMIARGTRTGARIGREAGRRLSDRLDRYFQNDEDLKRFYQSYAATRDWIRRRGRKPGQGVADIDETKADLATAAAEKRDELRQQARRFGFKHQDLKARSGERIDVDPTSHGLALLGKNRGDLRDANTIATALQHTDVWLKKTSKDGVLQVSLDEESIRAIQNVFFANKKFRDTLIMRADLAGLDPNRDWIITPKGRMPNITLLANKDSAVAEGLVFAAGVTALRQQEIARRNRVTSIAGTLIGSVADIAVRSADPNFVTWVIQTSNLADSKRILNDLKEAQLRLVLKYSGHKGLKNVSDDVLITSTNNVINGVDITAEIRQRGWENSGSFESMNPQTQAQIQKAIDQANEAIQAHLNAIPEGSRVTIGGKQYGLDVDTWRKSLGRDMRWRGQPNSLYEQNLKKYNGDHAKAYSETMKQVLPQVQQQFKQQYGRVPTDPKDKLWRSYQTTLHLHMFRDNLGTSTS